MHNVFSACLILPGLQPILPGFWPIYLALTPGKNELYRELEIISFYQGETEFTKPYTQWDGMMFCITS